MTTQGQNKKTVRHFQCRDYLWEIFEQMSAELECSTDYLINEAMRQYARSRNYGTNRSAQERATTPPGQATAPPSSQAPAIPSLRPSAVRRPSVPTPPPVRQPDQGYLNIGVSQRPASNVMRGPSVPPPPPTSRPAPSQHRMPQAQISSVPPPLPGSKREQAAEAYAQRPILFIIFNGQKIPVSKDEFVIGRSAKAADLPIKDGNISRRHAAVVFQGGYYFIKDLGSTNGIEYQGRQLSNKQIDEGDVFHLCDYELRFTYR
ncbi:MAG: FHA domain-containing protein [Deltaproteobacteria bacterium]|nr:FHA domain-containing protein [Deltaproteobacteria bacterium]